MSGKPEVTTLVVFPGVRLPAHIFVDLAEVRIEDHGSVQLDLDG